MRDGFVAGAFRVWLLSSIVDVDEDEMRCGEGAMSPRECDNLGNQMCKSFHKNNISAIAAGLVTCI